MKDWNALSLDEKVTYINDQHHELFKFIEDEFGKTNRKRLHSIDEKLERVCNPV